MGNNYKNENEIPERYLIPKSIYDFILFFIEQNYDPNGRVIEIDESFYKKSGQFQLLTFETVTKDFIEKENVKVFTFTKADVERFYKLDPVLYAKI